MKHSIINELYTCNQVLSVIEDEKSILIQIETFTNNGLNLLHDETFKLTKENLHSFIGTLLHVQSKLRK